MSHALATCCWCDAPLVEAEGVWWCGGSQAHRERQTTFATMQTDRKSGAFQAWLYLPTPVQTVWHEATLNPVTTRILVGGQAGPGKSRWLRESLYWWARAVPGLHALLLRRTSQDLNQSHLRFMPFEVKQRGGHYVAGPPAVVTFAHKGQPDSVIRAGHLESDGDAINYLSSEYDIIAPDELVTFNHAPMLELFSRARTTNRAMFARRGLDHADPQERLDGSMVLTASNPGGRGGLWVKDWFIDRDVDREAFPKYRPERWAFHGARLQDNPYMAAGYRQALEDFPEMRRRQLLEGDWSAHEGQFFSEWRPTRDGVPWHVRRLSVAA